MRVAVVGAGAWGLPAGAELAARGHEVVVLDAFGVANRLSSSGGATRLWRLAHAEPGDVALALESVRAWQRLEERSGRDLLLTTGLLWRDPNASRVAAALAQHDAAHEVVDPADVDRFFPGTAANGVPAVWQPQAGPVLAVGALLVQAGLLADAGGSLRTGAFVTGVTRSPDGVRLALRAVTDERVAGEALDPLDVDVAVLAPGPWAQPLLDELGVGIRLRPNVGQATHLTGREGWELLPCLHDADGRDKGVYAMPTPGEGYKLGYNDATRRFEAADRDRGPDAAETAQIVAAAKGYGFVDPVVGATQVCTWTDSPDGEFVLDTVADGRVVLAVGDSGHGFKFSALAGLWLADLAEGGDPGPGLERFRLSRFGTDA